MGEQAPEPVDPEDTEFSLHDEPLTDEMLLDRFRDRRPEVRALKVALSDLVNALDACQPGITDAFTFHHIHGGRYTGPTYNEELARARKALEEQE